MEIIFYGAAGVVTGSCYMVIYKGKKILIDCGMFQGSKETKERNYGEFPFNPQEIDGLILTHAHIDHSGLIPKLCKKGYGGKIFTTKVTKELCSIMLPDSGYIQEMEVERKNRKLNRANKPLLEPIYTSLDGEQCISNFVGIDYDTKYQIFEDVTVIFRDAGHIIGSSIIELYLGAKKIVFSGDLGRLNQAIINNPTTIHSADYLILESTYGNRFHIEAEDKLVQLTRVIKKTIRKGGNLIIPAFAVERTQDVLYHLRKLVFSGEIPKLDIYIDSPLAIKATEIFCKYPDLYDEEAKELAKDGCVFDFSGIKYTLSAEESIKLNAIKKNAIIISASGMCDAGRIKHHLKHNLWRAESTILFVGYQAVGTLGRRILEGEKNVRIHGEEVAVRADIEKIEGFSAHADQTALVDWVLNFKEKPKKIFLVHGEEDARNTLAQVLMEKVNSEIIIPDVYNKYDLTEDTGQRIEKSFSPSYQEKLLSLFTYFEAELEKMLDDERKVIISTELEKLKEKIL